MTARVAGTVILSTIVFIVVSLLVSLGVTWATGGVARGALIGVICGSAAAFTVGAVSIAVGRSGERSSDENERSGGSQNR
jgi:hypothetical protein